MPPAPSFIFSKHFQNLLSKECGLHVFSKCGQQLTGSINEITNENGLHVTCFEFWTKRETPAFMNCQSAKHLGDTYPHPSFLIFSSSQEFGIGVQSSREATVFTNCDGSYNPSI